MYLAQIKAALFIVVFLLRVMSYLFNLFALLYKLKKVVNFNALTKSILELKLISNVYDHTNNNLRTALKPQ